MTLSLLQRTVSGGRLLFELCRLCPLCVQLVVNVQSLGLDEQPLVVNQLLQRNPGVACLLRSVGVVSIVQAVFTIEILQRICLELGLSIERSHQLRLDAGPWLIRRPSPVFINLNLVYPS